MNPIPTSKTDVEGIGLQRKGVLVNLNHEEYLEYIQKRIIDNDKNAQITNLKDQINTLQEQMALILSRLDGK